MTTSLTTEKKVQFSPDEIGLNELLSLFIPLWVALQQVLDVIEQVERAHCFAIRKNNFKMYAEQALALIGNDPEQKMYQTIGFGAKLMKEVQDFLEMWVATADVRFDDRYAKIPSEIRQNHRAKLGDLRAAFTKENNGEDLAQAVLRCADVERYLTMVTNVAEKEQREAAERAKQELRERKEREKSAASRAAAERSLSML